MKKPLLIALSVGLLALALVIFMLTRSTFSPAAYSESLSAETPKPRPNSPTFASDSPAPTGGRNGVGRKAESAAPPGGAETPPPPAKP